MKELSINEMSELEGGGWLSGFCGVFGGAAAIAFITGASAATAGVGGVIAAVGVAGCAIYGLANIDQ